MASYHCLLVIVPTSGLDAARSAVLAADPREDARLGDEPFAGGGGGYEVTVAVPTDEVLYDVARQPVSFDDRPLGAVYKPFLRERPDGTSVFTLDLSVTEGKRWTLFEFHPVLKARNPVMGSPSLRAWLFGVAAAGGEGFVLSDHDDADTIHLLPTPDPSVLGPVVWRYRPGADEGYETSARDVPDRLGDDVERAHRAA